MHFAYDSSVRKKNVQFVMVERLMDLFQHGDSAMYWAARQGHTDAIQYLWEQKARVNTHNKV